MKETFKEGDVLFVRGFWGSGVKTKDHAILGNDIGGDVIGLLEFGQQMRSTQNRSQLGLLAKNVCFSQ